MSKAELRTRGRSLNLAARQSGAGLAAQLLTVGASLLPILFGLEAALIFSVQVSAVAAVLISMATGGAAVRIPPKRDRPDVAKETALGLGLLGCVGLGIVALAVLVLALHWDYWAKLLFGIALLLLMQGVYVIAAAILTRENSYAALMLMRLLYAVPLFALTLVGCLIDADPFWFVAASGASFFIGSFRLIPHLREFSDSYIVALRDVRIRKIGRLLGATRQLQAAFLFGGLASQMPAMLVTSLGPLAGPWAVVSRVSSGVQTIGLQLVAPHVDIGVATGLRGDDKVAVWGAFRRGLKAGSVLGILTIMGSLVGLGFLHPANLGFSLWLGWTVGLVGFAAIANFLGPTSRVLPMVDGVRAQFQWNVVKTLSAALAMVLAAAAGSGALALGVLGVTGLVLGVVYVGLVKSTLNSRHADAT